MRKLLSTFTVLLVVFLAQHSSAQEIRPGDIKKKQQEIIQASGVFVWNTSKHYELNFRITGDKCTPLDTSLMPDHYNTFNCPGAESFAFLISTKMPDGQLTTRAATLIPTKRYELFLERTGVWNIREAATR